MHATLIDRTCLSDDKPLATVVRGLSTNMVATESIFQESDKGTFLYLTNVLRMDADPARNHVLSDIPKA